MSCSPYIPLMICIRGSVAYFETGKTQNEQHSLQCCIDHTAHLKCQPYMTDQCVRKVDCLKPTCIYYSNHSLNASLLNASEMKTKKE